MLFELIGDLIVIIQLYIEKIVSLIGIIFLVVYVTCLGGYRNISKFKEIN